MSAPEKQPARAGARAGPLLPARDELAEVTAEEFRQNFGEDLARALDVSTWLPGDLGREYERIEREVRDAVRLEGDLQRQIRERIFPLLRASARAPKGAGVYGPVDVKALAAIHRGLLFNGGVEACDGNHLAHDTLPLTIHQIGIALVGYGGNQGTWCQRLFRRDLRLRGADPVDELAEVLARRDRRAALNHPSRRDSLSDMVRRAIMTYAERAILLEMSEATWRMGHGNPAPFELMTGGGSPELVVASLKVLRRLVEEHQKFVFVSSEPAERLVLTIGQALNPLEYAIVKTLDEGMYEYWSANGPSPGSLSLDTFWDGQYLTFREFVKRFMERVASKIVVGVYRATRLAPAHVFYAHEDHADLAAHVVLADSVLQEHRGFPLLIDLADNVCASVFGGETLHGLLATAYADAGAPWRYLSERVTRSR